MSNKATCPACGSHTSAVWSVINDERGNCPHCGLSGAAMIELAAASRRGADVDLLQKAAKAEQRADLAEQRVRELEHRLSEILEVATKDPEDWWTD